MSQEVLLVVVFSHGDIMGEFENHCFGEMNSIIFCV